MLQLLCPDGSTLPLAAHIVIGRATSAGGLQAVAAASRQQLELWPLEDAGNAVHLKALGQNALILERREGEDWHFDGILEAGESAVVGDGHRFYIQSRIDNSLFQVQDQPTPSRLASAPGMQLLSALENALQSSANVPDLDQPPAKRARTGLQDAPESSASSTRGGQPMEVGFALMRTNGIDASANWGRLGASIADLLQGDMQLVVVSNYMIDMRWLLSACPGLLSAKQLIVVHGEGEARAADIRAELQTAGLSHAVVHKPRLQPYGCHHSKFLIVQYPTGVRVIINTANDIRGDFCFKTQGVYWQDFPLKDANSPERSAFGNHLKQYLAALCLPNPSAKHAEQLCDSHDFSSARVALVGSVPSTVAHQGEALHRWGHMRVRALLSEAGLDPCFRDSPLIAQFSSLGSWSSNQLEDLCTSFCAGTPPVQEIRHSIEGWQAGASVPGTDKNVKKALLKSLWHRWGGEPVGRQRAMPHIKTYLRFVPGSSAESARGSVRLAWVLVGSHNLSMAAWGQLQNMPKDRATHQGEKQLKILHFELSVLLLPSLEEAYRLHRHFQFSCTAETNSSAGHAGGSNRGKQPLQFWSWPDSPAALQAVESSAPIMHLPVPYRLPPQKYTAADTPWTVDGQSAGNLDQAALLDELGCLLPAVLGSESMYGHVEGGGA